MRIQLSQSDIRLFTNETGFTSENVRAICNTGKSSKTKSEGFIGEKGAMASNWPLT